MNDPPRMSNAQDPEGVDKVEPRRGKRISRWLRRRVPGFLSAVFVGLIFLAIIGLGYLVLISIILGTKARH